MAEGPRADGTVATDTGFVVRHDCRGIQIGNGNRQYSTFAYTLAPTVPLTELLRARRDLAEKIVDASCNANSTDRGEMQRSLGEAVCREAEAVYQFASCRGMYGRGSREIRDLDGVSLGRDNERYVTFDVQAKIGRKVVRSLEEITPSLSSKRSLDRHDLTTAEPSFDRPETSTPRGYELLEMDFGEA